jgi:hypothetical protein
MQGQYFAIAYLLLSTRARIPILGAYYPFIRQWFAFIQQRFIMGMSSNIFSRGDSPKEEKIPKYLTAVRTFINDINFEGKVCPKLFSARAWLIYMSNFALRLLGTQRVQRTGKCI